MRIEASFVHQGVLGGCVEDQVVFLDSDEVWMQPWCRQLGGEQREEGVERIDPCGMPAGVHKMPRVVTVCGLGISTHLGR